jgi:hypothetical protein
MDPIQQPSVPPVTSGSPGIFGTKIPSSVAFAVGILLFFLPFAEIKCGGSVIAKNSGFGIAVGNNWQTVTSGKGMFGGMDETTETKKDNKRDPNIYAIAAMALGVLGLLLSFANVRAAAGAAVAIGVLSAAALIGLMLDLKKMVNSDPAFKDTKSDDGGMFGLDKIGDSMKPVLDFTPWFYVALIAFLAAAFFSYKRMTANKN